jgi:hypothetical protein
MPPPPTVLDPSLGGHHRIIPGLGAHRCLVPGLGAHHRLTPDLTSGPLLELGLLASSTAPLPPTFDPRRHRQEGANGPPPLFSLLGVRIFFLQ